MATRTLFSCWISHSEQTSPYPIQIIMQSQLHKIYFILCQPHPVQLQHRTQDLVCQGSKTVLSGHLKQEDFLAGQVTFHSCLPSVQVGCQLNH